MTEINEAAAKGADEARSTLPALLDLAEAREVHGHSQARPSRRRGCADCSLRGDPAGPAIQATLASFAERIGRRLVGRGQHAHDSRDARRMEPLKLEDLPANAVVLIDTAPIVYVLEGHPQLAQRFRPIFEAKEAGALQLAITTVTITEVMTGPEQSLFLTMDRDHDRSNYNELATRYREVFST